MANGKDEHFIKMKRKSLDVKQNPHFDEKKKYKGSTPLCDPKLIPRIKQYLEANKKKAMISVSLMADYIQSTYSRDYGRKKKNTFRITVEKGYEYVLSADQQKSTQKGDSYDKFESQHLKKKQKVPASVDQFSDSDSTTDDDEASFSSDNPDYVVHKDTNSMNNCIQGLYKKTPTSAKLDTSGYHSNRSSAPDTPKHPAMDSFADSNPVFVIDRKGDKLSHHVGSNYEYSPPSPINAPLKTVNITSEKKMGKKHLQYGSDPARCSGSPTSRSRGGTSTRTVTNTKDEHSARIANSEQLTLNDMASALGSIEHTQKEHKTDKQNKQYQEQTNLNQHDEEKDAEKGDGGGVEKLSSKKAKKRPKNNKRVADEESKKKNQEFQASTVKFADIGGNDSTLKEVCKLLVHMKHPEVYERLGISPPRGFLLHGPPGCGKTLLAHAIAGELELPFIKVAATELVSGVSGESEEKIRDIFDKATSSAPCVLFLDEVDAITPKRETASKDMERRIVSQLLSCMDDLNQKTVGHVLVIGATNRPDSLDPALRRAGRFDREISLGIPDQDARMRILQVLCKDLRLTEEFDFLHLARSTPGYVGADLMALAREAAITAVNRVFQELQKKPCASQHHLEQNESPDKANHNVASDADKCKHSTLPECQQSDVVDVESKDNQSIVNLEVGGVQNILDIAVNCPVDATNYDDGRPMDVTAQHATESTETAHIDAMDTTDAVNTTTDLVTEPKKVPQAEAEFKSVLSWLKDYPPLTDQQLDNLFISMEDFQEALIHVQPSAKREGFATVPDVTWDDIGALKGVREELQMAILAPVHHPEQFKALGLTNPPGILLAGPPGCGKTLLAKAIANESGINFISVKGPELLNMYVGESERAVRQVFQRARNSSPCVIFFDELDALCPRRSSAGEGGASVRVVNQLLTEMDGLETRKQVFIMGATNRPDIIDPAMLRPGRLDKVLYVGIPTENDRLDILNTITKNGTKPLLNEDVNMESIGKDPRCQGYTGADLAALIREAAVAALKTFMSQSQPSTQSIVVMMSDFDNAFQKVRPSVSAEDQLIFASLKKQQASIV